MLLELNGNNFEVDFFDADVLDNYQRALEPLQKADNIKKDNFSEFIREYCGITYRFFDTLLGEGTAKNLFGGKQNFKVCSEYLQKSIVQCNNYLENDFNKEFNQVIDSWNGLIK